MTFRWKDIIENYWQGVFNPASLLSKKQTNKQNHQKNQTIQRFLLMPADRKLTKKVTNSV